VIDRPSIFDRYPCPGRTVTAMAVDRLVAGMFVILDERNVRINGGPGYLELFARIATDDDAGFDGVVERSTGAGSVASIAVYRVPDFVTRSFHEQTAKWRARQERGIQ
jgi:hypothetical protein